MLVALAALAGAQTIQADPHSRAWLETLGRVAKAESAALCVDVDEANLPAPMIYASPHGYRGLDRLATAIGRSRSIVDGVHVFRRRLEPDDLRAETPLGHVAGVLTSLSAQDLSKLVRGDMHFSVLNYTQQRRLRHAIASSGKGLGDSMLAEYPDQIGMRLVLEPFAVCASRTGEGQVRLSLLVEPVVVPMPEKPAFAAPAPLGGPTDGPLDFGNGVVLTLAELATRAETAFGKVFVYDGRLANMRLFFSGRYTEKRLLDVVAVVTEPQPLNRIPENARKTDFSAERQTLLSLAFEPLGDDPIGVADLTMNDLVTGKASSFRELFGSKPPQRVQVFMAQYRLQPTDHVQIVGDLYLAVAAPGLATLYANEPDAIGRPIPYNIPHYIKFAF
jgi:hypothetical protein